MVTKSKLSKVGNDSLKAKALEAIKERMGKANILDETFSVFTSKSVACHTVDHRSH